MPTSLTDGVIQCAELNRHRDWRRRWRGCWCRRRYKVSILLVGAEVGEAQSRLGKADPWLRGGYGIATSGHRTERVVAIIICLGS